MEKRKSKHKADKSQVADRVRILSAPVDQFPIRALYVQVGERVVESRFNMFARMDPSVLPINIQNHQLTRKRPQVIFRIVALMTSVELFINLLPNSSWTTW